jgi:hypothetical protein
MVRSTFGMHITDNLDDEYLGSGKVLIQAVKKNGRDSFKKEILYVFDTEFEMREKERELVTDEFCQRKDTYNLLTGGKGGFGYINQTGKNLRTGNHVSEATRQKISENRSGKPSALKGRTLSEEHRKKISEANKIAMKKRVMSDSHRTAISNSIAQWHKQRNAGVA